MTVWKTGIQLCRGESDWIQVRECFVRAFHLYPLYIYMFPDENRRPEFLRRYLEAVYDVMIRNGDGVLGCLFLEQDENFDNAENEEVFRNGKIIGGFLMAPPSIKGGCTFTDNEAFIRSYRKFKLEEFDSEAFQRLERYEDWEYDKITKHLCDTGIPMWSGELCAIDPVYSSRGFGGFMFKYTFWEFFNKLPNKLDNLYRCGNVKKDNDELNNTEKKNNFFQRMFVQLSQAFTFLHHRPRILRGPSKKDLLSHNCDGAPTEMQLYNNNTYPMIFMLSHCRRSENFWLKNGFRSAGEVRFQTESIKGNCDKTYDFDANVLVLNIQKTYKFDDVTKAFELDR